MAMTLAVVGNNYCNCYCYIVVILIVIIIAVLIIFRKFLLIILFFITSFTGIFATGQTKIRNVYNWRVKETERMVAMVTELTKLGGVMFIVIFIIMFGYNNFIFFV